MRELPDILARWHDWRAGFSHERKLARVAVSDPDEEDDDRLERMLMASIDEEVNRLPQKMQLALAHVGRNTSLGYEVFHSPRLPEGEALTQLVGDAQRRLWHRLTYLGLL